MNARTYCLARFSGERRPRPVPLLAVAEAQEAARHPAVRYWRSRAGAYWHNLPPAVRLAVQNPNAGEGE